MPRKPKQAQKVTVAWECWYCGGTHLWKWDRKEAHALVDGPRIHMKCDYCDRETSVSFVRIGRNTWAGAW